ncbi:cuticle protein 6-like [Ctenocephalides felis]|uniref:cuticle protein 6-like n=1 Tax=Ctenocephalides felis TaxID=7515 RepID=UPI000E6E1B59|nr:cuticle protein 6-like [Ctenocephalides felis]
MEHHQIFGDLECQSSEHHVCSPLAGHSLAGYSQQYQSQDGHGSYAYGYADPNSQKTEHRSHDGTTHGEYSYVDGDGKLQAVKYVADHAGFHVAGTNLPQAPQQHGGYHTGAALVHSGGHGLYHGPHAAIGHDGHPIETPEVQAAKHAHFKAHAEAAAAAHYGPHQYQAYAPHYAGAGFGGHYQHAVA